MNVSRTASGRAEPEDVLDDIYRCVAERRRARRKRTALAGAVALLAGLAAVVTSLLVVSPSRSTVKVATEPGPATGLAGWVPPGPTRPIPAVFVDGDDEGGIGIYSTATGRLVRILSRQTSNGPDEQPVLSTDRRTVYYSQPTGACAAVIDTVPVRGLSISRVAISASGIAAIAPAPDPTGNRLAWVAVTCEPRYPASLWVTDLATGRRVDLGAFTGSRTDDSLAWNPSGTELAVEDASSIAVIDSVSPRALERARRLPVARGCALRDPVFLPGTDQLAVIQACTTPEATSSAALTINPATGGQLTSVALAPHRSSFVSITVDRTGQHILLGVQNAAGDATLEQTTPTGLSLLSDSSPTAQEW